MRPVRFIGRAAAALWFCAMCARSLHISSRVNLSHFFLYLNSLGNLFVRVVTRLVSKHQALLFSTTTVYNEYKIKGWRDTTFCRDCLFFWSSFYIVIHDITMLLIIFIRPTYSIYFLNAFTL